MNKPTTFKLTAEDRRILEALSKQMGLTLTGIVRFSIRELAKKRGVK